MNEEALVDGFPTAPPQRAGNLLTIEFRQFFYVAHCDGRGGKGFKGAVVLLPETKHKTLLLPGKEALRATQVDIFSATQAGSPVAMSKTHTKGIQRGSLTRLVNTKTLFGDNLKIQDGLLTSKHVPSRLNARVVLAGGKLDDLAPERAKAEHIKWRFQLQTKPDLETQLTDGLLFTLPMEAGRRYWIVLSDGETRRLEIPISDPPQAFSIRNDDEDSRPILRHGNYTLTDYATLHESVLVLPGGSAGKMSGVYPGDVEDADVFRPRGSAEPVCGGEEGDPEPPVDPPEPPDQP